MSNPFLEPRSLVAEQERRRRERFQLGVYLSLGAMMALLSGLLIQGCQRGQSAEFAAPVADSATNPTNLSAATSSMPETNTVAAPPPTAAPATNAVAAVQPVPTLVPEPTNSVAAPVPSAAPSVYQIKPGDTLLKIAKAHNTTVQALKAVNGLKSDRIRAGKTLTLPTSNSEGL